MYKSKLQELCHEKKWGLPRYTTIKEGPDHNPCFKASVVVNGFSFDSTHACMSSKQAQNQAAMLTFLHFTSPPASPEDDKVTLESPDFFLNTFQGLESGASEQATIKDEFQEDEPGHLYKNLLQELAQKEGLSMPAYTTVSSGASHMPTFSSIVDVDGEKFCGNAGKSRKQAELSAAKIAYVALKERALKTFRSANCRINVNALHEQEPPTINNKEFVEENKGSDDVSDSTNLEAVDCHVAGTVELEIDYINKTRTSPSWPETMFFSTQEHLSSPSISEDRNPQKVKVSDKNEGKSTGLKSYLLCNRFRVYTQFPDIEFPSCITVLPISDAKWVAVRLEFAPISS